MKTVLIGCFLAFFALHAQAQDAQPYLFYTLRTLVQAEQELGRGQAANAAPLIQWLHEEQHRLILQVAGTPDPRIHSDILEIEMVLREVQSLTGLRFSLVVSEPPAVFSVVTAEQLAGQGDSWLAEKLSAALTYSQALRTLAPSLDWHIVSLAIWPMAAPTAAKPAPTPPTKADIPPAPTVQPATTADRSVPQPAATAPQTPTPETRPATASTPTKTTPETPENAVRQVSLPVPEPARPAQQPAKQAPLPATSSALPPSPNSPEAIRLGLTHPRRPYTRMALVSIPVKTAANLSQRDSLGTAKLETITFSLESVQPDAQVVIDTVASWIIRQTAARFAALQNLHIDSLGCQTQVLVQGYAAGTLTNFAEITLKEVQTSFEGFNYTAKAAENNKTKKVTLSGQMTCYGRRPEE